MARRVRRTVRRAGDRWGRQGDAPQDACISAYRNSRSLARLAAPLGWTPTLAERGACRVIAVVDRLAGRWPERQETYFTRVCRVPPSHALRVDHHGSHLYRYWDPAPPERRVAWLPDDMAVEAFEARLEQAVHRGLALGPAGIFLSGDLDSSAVATVAADMRQRTARPALWAISMVLPHTAATDEAVQRGVATTLGLRQVLLSWDEAVGAAGLLAAALAHAHYDAVVLGWGSLCHIGDGAERERLRQALDQLCAEGPILASLWAGEAASEAPTGGRPERLGRALGRVVRRLRQLPAEPAAGGTFSLSVGFGYVFPRAEIERLAARTHRTVLWENDDEYSMNPVMTHVSMLTRSRGDQDPAMPGA